MSATVAVTFDFFIEAPNVQGNALAKLFRLPDSEATFASVLQNFLLAAMVEIIIVLSMVTFELLSPDKKTLPAQSPEKPDEGARAARRPRLVSN